MAEKSGNSQFISAGSETPTIAALPPCGGVQAPPWPLEETLRLADELRTLRSQSANLNDAVGQTIRVFMRMPGVVAASHFHRDDDNQFRASTPLICKQALAQRARQWEPHLVDTISKVVQKNESQVRRLPNDPFDLISIPIDDDGPPTSAFCMFADSGSVNLHVATLLVHVASARLGVFGAATTSRERGPLDSFLQSSIGRRGSADNFEHLAAALETTLQASQVLLGTRLTQGRCRLQAISGQSQIRRPSEMVTLAEEVLAEASLRGSMKVCDAHDPNSMNPAEAELSKLLRCSRLITGPLADEDGASTGAWIIVDDGTANATPRAVPLKTQCEQLAPMVAGITALVAAASPSRVGRVWNGFKTALLGENHRLRLAALSGLLLVMCIPWPYSIRCDCQLHPLQRRYVAAPYDGQLEEVLVKPGDLIEAGQVLARMDGSELQWRLAAQDAEYQSASKQHDSSMARRETSEAQVARLEMQRLAAERELLKKRSANLEIKSPIDGIVLDGDPKQLEGARLTIGQTLIEAGPLHCMVAEVYIPHDEIAHFAVDNHVSIRMDALPHRRFDGQVIGISPQSETNNGQNVFVAELELDNPDLLLRPGMVGRARIRGDSHPVAWNLFHRPFARLIRLLRW